MPVSSGPSEFEYESSKHTPSTVNIIDAFFNSYDVWGWTGTLQSRQTIGEVYKVPGIGYSFINIRGIGAPATPVSFIDAYDNENDMKDAMTAYFAMRSLYIQITNDYLHFPAVLVHNVNVNYQKKRLGIDIESPPSVEGGSATYETKILTYVLQISMDLEVQ